MRGRVTFSVAGKLGHALNYHHDSVALRLSQLSGSPRITGHSHVIVCFPALRFCPLRRGFLPDFSEATFVSSPSGNSYSYEAAHLFHLLRRLLAPLERLCERI